MKATVRIIKRHERGEAGKYINPAMKGGRATVDAERELKRTVSGWVHEFQQRRLIDSGRAFSELFNRRAVAYYLDCGVQIAERNEEKEFSVFSFQNLTQTGT